MEVGVGVRLARERVNMGDGPEQKAKLDDEKGSHMSEDSQNSASSCLRANSKVITVERYTLDGMDGMDGMGGMDGRRMMDDDRVGLIWLA